MTKEDILDQAIPPIALNYIERCVDNYEEGIGEFDLRDYELYQDGLEWVVYRNGHEGEIARI